MKLFVPSNSSLLPTARTWRPCSESGGARCSELSSESEDFNQAFDAQAPGGPLLTIAGASRGCGYALVLRADGSVQSALAITGGFNHKVVGASQGIFIVETQLRTGDETKPGHPLLGLVVGIESAVSPAKAFVPVTGGASPVIPYQIWSDRVWSLDEGVAAPLGQPAKDDKLFGRTVLVSAAVHEWLVAISSDRAQILSAKLGGEPLKLREVPSGTTVRGVAADASTIGWVEQSTEGCTVFTSPFADAVEKFVPRELGKIPCARERGLPQMVMGPGTLAVNDALITLADGHQRDWVGPECAGTTSVCLASVLGLTKEDVYVRSHLGTVRRYEMASLKDAAPVEATKPDAGAPN